MKKLPPKKLLEVFGTTAKSPTSKRLEAGSLIAEFSNGNLSNIRFRGIEVLRGISWLVRDENWGTCAVGISSLKTSNSSGKCIVSYKGTAQLGGNVLRYNARILISSRRLEFVVTATPDKDFRTNRTGFVVLHPIDGVAGKQLKVTHIDGTTSKSRFPKLISPGQPFFNIRALVHAPAPGLKAHVWMEGHKFEMEDQRNWGDASYKTYVCSLLDPLPYVLKGGESFTQKITLTIAGTAKAAKKRTATMQLGTLRPNARLPQIGLSITEDDAAETLARVQELKALAPGFLLGLYEAGKTTPAALETFAQIIVQTAISFRAEIVLSVSKDAQTEMAEVRAAFHAADLVPSAIVVTQAHDLKSFQPTDTRPWGPSYEEMAEAARAHFPGIPIGGGMISYFTELNRKRPPKGLFDFITHSICPLAHDASDVAVMQTL
jgi:D-apionolactonase